jgi:hypothetical protein
MFFSLDAVEGRKYVVASERQERKKKTFSEKQNIADQGKIKSKIKKDNFKTFLSSFFFTYILRINRNSIFILNSEKCVVNKSFNANKDKKISGLVLKNRLK